MKICSFGSAKRLKMLAVMALVIDIARAQSIYTPYSFSNFAGQPMVEGWLDATGGVSQLHIPHSVAVDALGNLFVADTFNHVIRMVTPAGVMTTITGSPSNKGYGDGVGFAEAATFNSPIGVGADADGNLYVADNGNQTIRKVTSAGVVTQFAGQTGLKGKQDGNRLVATFNSPHSTVVDSKRNVFVSDGVNRVIRKIAPDGTVSLFAGTYGQQGTNDGVAGVARFQQPMGLAVDHSDNLYVADQGGYTIRKIETDGMMSTMAGKGKVAGSADGQRGDARFLGPEGVAVDTAGNVYVSDTGNQTIRKITPTGLVTTLAGTAGTKGAADGLNVAALFRTPRGITVNTNGVVYVADSGNSSIRKLVIDGANCTVTTFAGTSGENGSVDAVGMDARFHFPEGITHDAAGNLYTVDRSNVDLRKIAPDGTVTTIAGVPGFIGSTDGTGAAAQFYQPEELAVAGDGSIFVVEHANNTVRKIAPVGTNWVVTTIAGCPTCPMGTNDGPGLLARFNGPFGLTRDIGGNIYVADTGNKTIRRLTQTGDSWMVSTFAGTPKVGGSVDGMGAHALLAAPLSLAIDTSDTLFMCDGGTIRTVKPDGTVMTIAGGFNIGNTDGPGLSALFWQPRGIAVDVGGNVFVGDQSNQLIRKLTPNGAGYAVTTLGGAVRQAGFTDGVGIDARFNQPSGVAVDAAGSLYVVDSGAARITKGVSTSVPVELKFETGGLSVSGNLIMLKLITPNSGSVVVEWSADLLNWQPIKTNTLSGSSLLVSLPFDVNLNAFFRLRLGL